MKNHTMILANAIAEENIAIEQARSARRAFFATKRFFDLTISFLMLPTLGLTTIIVKLLYLCTGDLSPIFYQQTRITKGNKEFVIYKFRTMVRNSDNLLAKLLEDPDFRQEWESHRKLENDPRITKVGKFLRKSSIDELPQILNILKGDMSIIGPRPITCPEVEVYGENQALLLSIRPGLTGWWACNGRSCTSEDERRRLELYYCQNLSLALDAKCLAKTIVKVIKQEGAK